MHVVFCIAWALSLAGWTKPQIRHEAALVLRCPENEIELAQQEGAEWFAGGCGRGALCALPAYADAEVQCRVGVGWIDKEEISRVVRENLDEIRYCYRLEQTNSPRQGGKIAVKFTISANGSVSSSEVVQSSMANEALEECVAARVRAWTFPKPHGEGEVIVSYPFIFMPSGI